MSDQVLTARMVMDKMPGAFVPEKAQGVATVVQYLLDGEGGGEWYSIIAAGSCSVTEGRTSDAKLTITMQAQDYVDLITGKLEPMKAFMTGKIQLKGDFGLATRLSSFFRAP